MQSDIRRGAESETYARLDYIKNGHKKKLPWHLNNNKVRERNRDIDQEDEKLLSLLFELQVDDNTEQWASWCWLQYHLLLINLLTIF